MAPTIFAGASSTGITHKPGGSAMFGPLGPVFAWTFHHSAGPRATTAAKAKALHAAYQADHIAQGWGDIAYHFSMDDLGRIYRLRPLQYKGSHVGNHNTGNIGFMVHGNYDHDMLNAAQEDTLRWLFRGGFHELAGVTERQLALVRGHQEWPGPTNRTDCPGVNLMRHVRFLRNTETF